MEVSSRHLTSSLLVFQALTEQSVQGYGCPAAAGGPSTLTRPLVGGLSTGLVSGLGWPDACPVICPVMRPVVLPAISMGGMLASTGHSVPSLMAAPPSVGVIRVGGVTAIGSGAPIPARYDGRAFIPRMFGSLAVDGCEAIGRRRSAAAVAAARWDDKTRGAMASVELLYEQYMSLPDTRGELTWDNTVPTDVVDFLHIWSGEHGRSPIGDGLVGACPQYLKNTVSHLVNLFDHRGRCGPWCGNGFGNPANSPQVVSYIAGYGKIAARAGYRKVSAVPWGYDRLCPLIVALDRESNSGAFTGKPHVKLLIQRDLAVLCFMAVSGKRGGDVGNMYAEDVTTTDGTKMDPRCFHPPEGSRWVVTMFSKTRKLQPGPPLCLTYTAIVGKRETNFLWRLEQYLACCADRHLVSDTFLFGPHGRGKPLAAATLLDRVKGHMKRHSMYCGETMHGLRRGLTQDLTDDGFAPSAIAQHLDMRSSATYARYNDRDVPLHYSN